MVTVSDGRGQDRHDHSGQGTTDDDLEQDGGHLVGGDVCGTQTGVADGLGEDDRPPKTCEPRPDGDHRDEQCGRTDPVCHPTVGDNPRHRALLMRTDPTDRCRAAAVPGR